MICKSLATVAMICLLAAFASVSAGTASEEGAADQSALSGTDVVTTVDGLDEMTNGSSSYSTNQSSNESSNESSARNVTVIDLSTLDNGTESEESPNATVIGYTPSVIEEVGAESVSSGVTDVKALSETLGLEVSENALDLSTLDNGTDIEESPNATVIGYTPSVIEEVGAESVSSGVTDVKALSETLGLEVSENALDLSTTENVSSEAVGSETTMISYTVSSSNESDGVEPADVRVLGNVLGTTSTSSSVKNLSTLGGESVADDEMETTYTSLSSSSTNESEVTDVQELSEILGYSAEA
jgi:hypothetical protein